MLRLMLIGATVALCCACTQAPVASPMIQGQRFAHPEAISFKDINTSKAQRVGIMRFKRQEKETVPYSLNSNLVVDVGVLTQVEPQTCARFTINTDRVYDVPGEKMEIQSHVDGELTSHQIVKEHARVTQYPYDVRPVEADVQNNGVKISLEKVDKYFSLTSRELQICCPKEASSHVQFQFFNRLLGANEDETWKVSFEWHLRP